ncbi:EamA family transporter [Paraburkholderia sp. JPY303]|nr:EamA family transporter [Paraburkholderia atlantica]
MSSPSLSDARSGAVVNDHAAKTITMRSFGALLVLAVMWGLSIPVTKLGLESLPPLTLTAMRFAVAVPLLLIFAVGRHPLPRHAWPRVAMLGVLGIGIGQVAQTFGVAGTSASVGTIISATIPVFIVFFAALRLKQQVSGWQKLGLLAAFSGIALVAFAREHGAATLSDTTAGGAICVLLSALAIAFYYVWSVELTTAYGTATVAAWSTLFGFVALLPWAAWEMWHVPFHVTTQGVSAAVYLGVIVTVAGLFMWLKLLRIVPARVAASVQFIQPVFGIAAASFMFGDRVGPSFVVGVALVLVGLALTMVSRNEVGNRA